MAKGTYPWREGPGLRRRRLVQQATEALLNSWAQYDVAASTVAAGLSAQSAAPEPERMLRSISVGPSEVAQPLEDPVLLTAQSRSDQTVVNRILRQALELLMEDRRRVER